MTTKPRQTSAQAVDAYFSTTDASQLSNREHDERVWGHDFMHAMLGTNLSSNRSEEITGIYQAVLFRTSVCSTVKRPWADGGDIPSLDEIKTKTLPKLRAFVKRFLDSVSLKLKPGAELSDREIDLYYKKAILLDRAIHKAFGAHLGEIPLEEVKAMPMTRFTDLVHQVDNGWKKAKGLEDPHAARAFMHLR